MFESRLIAIFVCLSIGSVTACHKSEPHKVSDSSTSTITNPPAPAEQPQATPPASTAELQAVISRAYKNAVILDNKSDNHFVVGDFNGDGSQDIAIVVKPEKGMLSELNSEYANWILGDPLTVEMPSPQKVNEQVTRRPAVVVTVRQNDSLLAVIHGHEEAGWRDQKATQTYLLKNIVGEKIEAQPASLISATANKERLPQLRGDVIQVLSGSPGFIYWTGAKYAWHTLATGGSPERGSR